MSGSQLKKISVANLRGCLKHFDLTFDGKKLTIVYGQNGSGKSTLCDAFEFIGDGHVGSLDNRGLGRTPAYWHSLGKNSHDIQVAIESVTGICCASMHKGNVHVQPENLRPKVEILRRARVLSLLEAKPGERYEAIRHFVDVTGVEESEKSLRALIKDIKNRREIAIARIQENRTTIEQFWEAAGQPGAKPGAWAQAEVKKDTKIINDELNLLGKIRQAFTTLSGSLDTIKNLQPALLSAQRSQSIANERHAVALNHTNSSSGDLLDLLNSAKHVLHSNSTLSSCPLCESTEKIEGLEQRVNQRISELSELQITSQAVKEAARSVELQTGAIESEHVRAAQTLKTLIEHIEEAKRLNIDIQTPDVPRDYEHEVVAAFLVENQAVLESWSTAEAIRRERSQFIGTLRSALRTWQVNYSEQKQVDAQLPRMEAALVAVTEERIKFTDAILAEISTEVGRIYEKVHPGEGLNKISLQLDPNKRASLDISASFGNAEVPPQAYFSDSHLDTLGLCVFIALAKREDPHHKILVLDDVLGSVDEPHIDRLIEMICEEAANFRHCLVTTHYRPWKEKLRWGWLQTGQCQFVELATWSDQDGLRLIRTMPDLEKLQELLAEEPPDPQLLCSKAGYILEAALNFLTKHYECAVPRKPEDRYTIGDLLPSIKGKLRESLRVEVLTGNDSEGKPVYENVSLTPILQELTRIAEARNVFGCHFKEVSFELLDSDAIAFSSAVAKLMKLLTDGSNGWVMNGRSGSYWATAGETRRMHPYRKPS